MSIWDSIKNTVSGWARKSRVFRSLLYRTGISPSFSIQQYKDYAQEGYEENPYVYSVIDNIMTSCASIPPRLYRIEGGGAITAAQEGYERKGHGGHYGRHKKRRAALRVLRKRTRKITRRTGLSSAKAKERATKALVERGELEPIESHEILDLLDRPNPWFQRSYGAFIKSVVAYLELGGEVYLEPVFPNDSAEMPRELYAHAPKQIQFESDRSSTTPIQEINIADQSFQYTPDPTESEIWYMKYFHPRSPLRGLSPVEAAARSIDINNEGRGWNLSLLQNGAEISGILSFEEGMDDTARDRLSEQIKESVEPGDILKADGSKFDFQQLSMDPKDMQWGDLADATATEVALVWGVPPEIIGKEKTYENFDVANKVYHQTKIIPLMDFVFGELNSTLVPNFGDDLLLDYDISGVEALQTEESEMHERVREDVSQGILTINEGRETIGRDSIDGGDVILIPSTQVPLTAVSSQSTDERAAQLLPEEGDGIPEKLSLEPNGESYE